MSEHECKHETDLALMAKSLENVCTDVQEIKKAIIGNGQEGLKTRVAIIEKNIDEAPSAKQLAFYASVGGGFVVVLAMLAQWAI